MTTFGQVTRADRDIRKGPDHGLIERQQWTSRTGGQFDEERVVDRDPRGHRPEQRAQPSAAGAIMSGRG